MAVTRRLHLPGGGALRYDVLPADGETPPAFLVLTVTVPPAVRRQGRATQLITQLMVLAARRGAWVYPGVFTDLGQTAQLPRLFRQLGRRYGVRVIFDG